MEDYLHGGSHINDSDQTCLANIVCVLHSESHVSFLGGHKEMRLGRVCPVYTVPL